MPTYRLVRVVICIGATMFVAGCDESDEPKPSAAENPGTDAPALPTPVLDLHIHIHSTDPNAMAANDLLHETIEAIDARFVDPLADYVRPSSAADWEPAEGCSQWSFDAGDGCPWTYEVCDGSTGFAWTDGFGWAIETDTDCGGRPASVSGSGGKEAIARHGFAVVDGGTSADGATGELRFNDHDLEVTTLTWRWTGLSGRFGTWTFFEGLPETRVTPAATLTWEVIAEGETQLDACTFEEPGHSRFEFRGTFGLAAGEMDILAWNGSAWVIQDHVDWDNAGEHGHWTTFNDAGEPEETHEW